MKWFLILAGLLLAPAVAQADPCEGRLPSRSGETFSVLVRYIGDGDSLCLGPSIDPATWIEIRLADFDAPELNNPTARADRHRLSRLVNRRVLDCVAGRGRNGRVTVYDLVIATAKLNRLGSEMCRDKREAEMGTTSRARRLLHTSLATSL